VHHQARRSAHETTTQGLAWLGRSNTQQSHPPRTNPNNARDIRRLKRVQVSPRLSPRLFSREWEATEVNCPFCLQSVLSILACSAYSPVSCMKHRIPHVTNTIHHLSSSGQARPEHSWQQPHPLLTKNCCSRVQAPFGKFGNPHADT
jgi:hypothetical protein